MPCLLLPMDPNVTLVLSAFLSLFMEPPHRSLSPPLLCLTISSSNSFTPILKVVGGLCHWENLSWTEGCIAGAALLTTHSRDHAPGADALLLLQPSLPHPSTFISPMFLPVCLLTLEFKRIERICQLWWFLSTFFISLVPSFLLYGSSTTQVLNYCGYFNPLSKLSKFSIVLLLRFLTVGSL